ncbi:MAG: N-acetylmuramoyl-L-alanine amidase [Clostridia bacterium]|nr:N-acetylmuramoyl-L-alanine amidase [Clostridia bacterium]
MNHKKAQKPISYALDFIFFCILAALLTLILVLLMTKFESREKSPTERAVAMTQGVQKSSVTVVIDAGHGGEDGGASSVSGALEKDLNLDIAFLLADMLRANGINVVMTRTEDILLYDPTSDYHGRKKVLDLAARLKIAKETPNSVFVSIHMNSFPQTQYSGLQVYYSKNDKNSKTVADLIQSNVKAYLQPSNTRKTKGATSAIFLLDRLETPAVLIECGFLSNYEEARRLSNAEYRKKLAFVIFCSLCDYISNNNP